MVRLHHVGVVRDLEFKTRILIRRGKFCHVDTYEHRIESELWLENDCNRTSAYPDPLSPS